MTRLRARGRRRGGEEEAFPGFSEVVEIGSGGFSTVYRAREDATNRPVALKLLRVGPQVTAHALESFRRETLALGALSAHPHIVTLYHSFTTPAGLPVLVLELCRGSMSARLAAEGAVAPEEAVSIAIRIAGALATAHEVGMLHRDVKPQNVLLTTFGEPALADFGVARLQASAEQAAGAFGFTTLHAPPELLEGAPASAATDVYELASTLYQLCSGRPAFQLADDEDPAAAALRILRDPVRPLVRPGVPVALSDLLVAAMSKAPEDRPASARAFAASLQEIAAVARWAPTRAVTREGALVPPAVATEPPGPPGPPEPPGPPDLPEPGDLPEPPELPEPPDLPEPTSRRWQGEPAWARTNPRPPGGGPRPAGLVPPPVGARRVVATPRPGPSPARTRPAPAPTPVTATPPWHPDPTPAVPSPPPVAPTPLVVVPPPAGGGVGGDPGFGLGYEPARSPLEETRLRPGLREEAAGADMPGSATRRRRPWWRRDPGPPEGAGD